MKPKVVFLDWDGTMSLIRFWGHWRQTRPTDWTTIQEKLFWQSRPLVHAWMRGQLTSEDVCAWLEREHGLPAAETFGELRQNCEAATLVDPALPNMITKLRRRGHIVVLATDNMDTLTRWTVPALGFEDLFDAIISSHQLGVLKSDVTDDESWPFFDQFLKDQTVDYQACILIDNSTSIEPIAAHFGLPYRRVTDKHPLIKQLQLLLER